MESKEVLTKQERIAQLAKIHPEVSFTSLAYHIDLKWLLEAYRRTRKDGAVGVDNQTASDYEKNLADNLKSLLERAKSGTYFAPPVRRVEIPKGTGKETRPIGIPTFEDKVLQRAVCMVLEPLYEQDFINCSYGFRPNRSAHSALEALRNHMVSIGGGWIIDLDIRKFFDTMVHKHLRDILKLRVCDGVLTRLIGKWLKAGVMEKGNIHYPKLGSPQGGVVSPLLSNIYLHEVLDKWFTNVVKPRLKGQAFIIRYADDAVLGFSCEEDALKVMEVLPKRFGKYGLKVHQEKTKVVDFNRPKGSGKDKQKKSFNFLGFTHYWALSRKGYWVIKRKTEKSRFSRGLKRIAEWCKWNRHKSLEVQQKALARKLYGHYSYYGITANRFWLSRFYYQVRRIWRKWLSRRSRRRDLQWEKFVLLIKRYPLPLPRVVHSVYHAKL